MSLERFKYERAASVRQRRYLADLARRAGLEMPAVVTAREATDAISRLERRVREPELELRWETR